MVQRLSVLCVCVFQIITCQFLYEESCATVADTRGTCVVVTSCEPYLKLLKKFGLTPKVQDLLKKSVCGYEGSTPKVCCPPQTVQPSTVSHLQTTTPTYSVRNNEESVNTNETDYISAFPSPPECGISNASFSRIVGGVDAELGDLPWMALLGYAARSFGTSWMCGGSLISAHHVITAAHCIHKKENSLYIVRLGELDLDREDEGATPTDVLIKRMIKHEHYNPTSFENDIGLLVLQDSVEFTKLIRPICLPTDEKLRSMNFVGWTPLVAGWGKLSTRGAQATKLQVLQLPVLSDDVCVQNFSLYKELVIDDRVICAGYTTGGKDACKGDSGGPLMQAIPINQTSIFHQIGVVSFGLLECARPGFPGIYTRITTFIPWLERHTLGLP